MNKLFAVLAPLFVASTVMAAPEAEGAAEAAVAAGPMVPGLAAGLAVLGGLGIGRIGGTACEATARQPEVKNLHQHAADCRSD